MATEHARPPHALHAAAVALAATLCLAIAGCAVEGATDGAGDDEVASGLEVAHPGETGELREGTFNVRGVSERLQYELLHGQQVYQGDIVLGTEGPDGEPDDAPPEESAEPPPDLLEEPPPDAEGADTAASPEGDLSTTVQALAARRDPALWPRGVVYYTVDPRLPNKDRVWNAIRHWRRRTPIRFVRRTNQQAYVTFRAGSGCSATIGYTGRRQYVWLARGCSTGNAIHEIGHTVGLWHEQSRTDRNEFVTIHWDNIDPRHRSNFQTYAQLGVDGRNVGRYDYGSIMHYPATAFSRNGRRTITTRNGARIGQRSGLSDRDVAGIRAIY